MKRFIERCFLQLMYKCFFYIEWIHSDDHLDTDNTLFMRHRPTVQARINVNFDILHAMIKHIYFEMANQNLKQCIETFHIIVDTLFFACF